MLFIGVYLTVFLIKCFASCEENYSKVSFSHYDCEKNNNYTRIFNINKNYTTTSFPHYDYGEHKNPIYLTYQYEGYMVIKLSYLTPYFKNVLQTVRSEITNSVGSIKGYCESEINEFESDLLMRYVGVETNSCYEPKDAKNFCYCSVYYIIFSSRYNSEVDLETFHLNTFDLKCPVRNPIRKNLNYYRLKKKLFKQIELIRSR